MTFAENLKRLRREYGMTQKDLGLKIGKSSRVISYYENEESGSTIPDVDTLKILSQVFNVSVDELIGTKQEKTKIEALVDRLLEYTVDGDAKWENVQEFLDEPNTIPAYKLIVNLLSEFLWKRVKTAGFYTDPELSYILFGYTDYFLSFDAADNEYYLLVARTHIEKEQAYVNEDYIAITNSEVHGKLQTLYQIICGDKDIQENVQIEMLIQELDDRYGQKDKKTGLPFDF